jgi:DNA-binding transcriptional MocR family regulator
VYRSIAQALADDVAQGRLPPGSRLPTHRDLAYRLGVTIGTVTRAYGEAERSGLIEATVGRGTFVRDPQQIETGLGNPCFAALVPPPLRTQGDAPADLGLERMHRPVETGDDLINLSLNYPYALAQGAALGEALRLMADPAVLEGVSRYQPPNGMPAHRAAGAAWLKRLDLDADPNDLLIVAGCQSGFSIIAQALTRPGDAVLHESLTWPGITACTLPLGLRLVPVATDDDGLIPDALEAACREHRPRLLYTMPTLHNPTAVVMSEERRRAIATIVRRHGVFVAEDDVYGFLLDERPPPLRAFAPELALYVTSLSKAVMAGLRIGYIWAPRALVPRLAGAIRASLLMTSSVAAQLATELIRSGGADQAAAAQRQQARTRQRLAAAALAGFPFRTHPQAFHGWLRLPDALSSDDAVNRLLERGVSVTPGSAFAGGAMPEESRNHIRLCLCAVAETERLNLALRIVADVVRGGEMARMPVV